MNSRTSNECDYILFDKYLDENQPFVCKHNSIQRRSSKDPVIDAYGKQLLQLCNATGFVIANGRLGNDKTGEFPFATQGVQV